MTLEDLLDLAREVQREVYGVDPVALGRRPGERRRSYAAGMVAGCHAEVTELGDLLQWRWWKSEPRPDPRDVAAEAADVLLFWANMVNLGGVDAGLLTAALEAKIALNRGRHNPIGEACQTGDR